MGRQERVKLYISNIPFKTTEEELLRWAADCGFPGEHVQIVMDHETQRPRGFGFMTMIDGTDEEAAIKALNGRIVGGRDLVVAKATRRAAKG